MTRPGRQPAMLRKIKTQKGFTLVELMIALSMSAIVVASIYAAFRVQQKSSTAQTKVVIMQQNIRAATTMLMRELRMAGLDTSDTRKAGAQIYVATSSAIAFSADLNEDGDVNDAGENIGYDIYTVTHSDGSTTQALGRVSSSATLAVSTPAGGGTFAGHQPLSEDITNLEFLYLVKDSAQCSNAPHLKRTLTPTNSELDDIEAVEISLMAVTEQRDAGFTTAQQYVLRPDSSNDSYLCVDATSGNKMPDAQKNIDWTGTAATDGLRRRLVSVRVALRNSGS